MKCSFAELYYQAIKSSERKDRNREPKVNIKYNDPAMLSNGKGLQYKLNISGSYGAKGKPTTKGKRSKSLKSRANRRKAK